MAKHIEVHKLSGSSGEVVLVRMLDKNLTNPALIQKAVGEITELVDEGHTRLVIAFANVEMLMSPCLNALITLKNKLEAKSGVLRICSLQQTIRDVFGVTHLDKYFVIKATEKEALADF